MVNEPRFTALLQSLRKRQFKQLVKITKCCVLRPGRETVLVSEGDLFESIFVLAKLDHGAEVGAYTNQQVVSQPSAMI